MWGLFGGSKAEATSALCLLCVLLFKSGLEDEGAEVAEETRRRGGDSRQLSADDADGRRWGSCTGMRYVVAERTCLW